MEKIATIGLDIAKHVFRVHGINCAGSIVTRRRLRRDNAVGFFRALLPCLIDIEACATGHHCARVLTALGNEVRLMPAFYVKRAHAACPHLGRRIFDAEARQGRNRCAPADTEERRRSYNDTEGRDDE